MAENGIGRKGFGGVGHEKQTLGGGQVIIWRERKVFPLLWAPSFLLLTLLRIFLSEQSRCFVPYKKMTLLPLFLSSCSLILYSFIVVHVWVEDALGRGSSVPPSAPRGSEVFVVC